MLCTGLKPREVDILIVNCSLFNPTPSLSAMLVNHYKMRSDVLTYNLAGMGCSAGVIAIQLAKELLQVLNPPPPPPPSGPHCIMESLNCYACHPRLWLLRILTELQLPQVYPRSRCVVLSTENITQNWYFGNQRSMLIPNCLFRIGGAAMYLTNRRRDWW